AIQVRPRIYRLISKKSLIFPLAVALVRRVLSAPSGALLHHSKGFQVCFDEAAIAIPRRIATGIQLDVVANQGNHGPAWQRLILTRGIKGGGPDVNFTVLFGLC